MADLPDRLRELAEHLESQEWENPITASDDCRQAANELDAVATSEWDRITHERDEAQQRLAAAEALIESVRSTVYDVHIADGTKKMIVKELLKQSNKQAGGGE